MTRHTDDTTTNRWGTSQRTMSDVSHADPATGETFGDSQVFQRGTVAMVDGGSADRHPTDDGGEAESRSDGEPMGDVDHTPREDAPEANEAYVRGVDREDGDEEPANGTQGPEDEEPV